MIICGWEEIVESLEELSGMIQMSLLKIIAIAAVFELPPLGMMHHKEDNFQVWFAFSNQ